MHAPCWLRASSEKIRWLSNEWSASIDLSAQRPSGLLSGRQLATQSYYLNVFGGLGCSQSFCLCSIDVAFKLQQLPGTSRIVEQQLDAIPLCFSLCRGRLGFGLPLLRRSTCARRSKMAAPAFSMPASLSTISLFASSSSATTSLYLVSSRPRPVLNVPRSIRWVSIMVEFLRMVVRSPCISRSSSLRFLVV